MALKVILGIVKKEKTHTHTKTLETHQNNLKHSLTSNNINIISTNLVTEVQQMTSPSISAFPTDLTIPYNSFLWIHLLPSLTSPFNTSFNDVGFFFMYISPAYLVLSCVTIYRLNHTNLTLTEPTFPLRHNAMLYPPHLSLRNHRKTRINIQ